MPNSLYPAQIDNSTSLPQVIDNSTPVSADAVNALRSATIAIETTLGTTPNGVYSSVGARLNILENIIAQTPIINIAGDIGGTNTNPLVIGLQGRPISTVAPVPGQLLYWNGLAWGPITTSAVISFSGDLSGTTISQTVIGLNGQIISGSPTAGQFLIENSGATSPTWTTISGDISSSVDIVGNFTVTGLQGINLPIPNASGTVLTYNSGSLNWLAPSSGGGAGGDLSGSYPNPTVVALRGYAVSSSPPSAGNQLIWNGSFWAPTALNLAGGTDYLMGILPIGNQAAQTMTGDVTGTTASSTVAKINGSTVPAGGSLTTGNILQVVGSSSLSYGPLNLAGGTDYLTGVLPIGNQAAQTMGGDVSGTTASTTVTGIQDNPVSSVTAVAGQFLIENSSATGSAWTSLSGDIEASVVTAGSITVTGIQGRDVSSSAPTSGYSLIYNGSQWAPASAFSANGDLTGTSTSQTVVGWDGYAFAGKVAPGQTYQLNTNNQLVPQGIANVINVLTYGADPTGSFDSSTAIQNAITAANGLQEVFFPAGSYAITQPIWINISFTKLRGLGSSDDTNTCVIHNSYSAAPIFYCAGVWNIVPYFTTINNVSYVRMWGSTSVPDGYIPQPWINLAQRFTGSLHGFSAFTVEVNVQDNNFIGESVYLYSLGKPTTNSSYTSAFYLRIDNGTQHYQASVTTTAGTFSVESLSDFTSGTPVSLAATYDGSYLRLYVDGYFQNHTAVTGTVIQNWYENFALGATSYQYPSDDVSGSGDIYIGNLRLSNIARYTSESGGQIYTPPLSSNLTNDSNTILLLTLDATNRFANSQMIKGITGNGIPIYYNWKGATPSVGSDCITIEKLAIESIYGEGIYCELSNQDHFRDLYVQAPCCITKYNNCFYGEIRDCCFGIVTPYLQATYRNWNQWGICHTDVCGIETIQNINYPGAVGWGLILANGSGSTNLHNVLLNTQFGPGSFYFRGCYFINLDNVTCGDENAGDGTGVGFCQVVLDACTNTLWRNGTIELTYTGLGAVHMLVDQGSNNKIATFFAAQTSITQPYVHFVANSFDALDLDASVGNQLFGSGNYAATPPYLTTQWSDGYGHVILSRQELCGINTWNWASSASTQTIDINDFLWGTLTITDTNNYLSGTGTLILPRCASPAMSYFRTIRNQTSQTLTVGGSVGGTISITSGSSVKIVGCVQPISGTVTFSGYIGTGSGTSFLTQLAVNDTVWVNYLPATVTYPITLIVTAVSSDTSVTFNIEFDASDQELLANTWLQV
jgi:hypothetical protein